MMRTSLFVLLAIICCSQLVFAQFANMTTIDGLYAAYNEAFNFGRDKINERPLNNGPLIFALNEKVYLLKKGGIQAEALVYKERYYVEKAAIQAPHGLISLLQNSIMNFNSTVTDPAIVSVIQRQVVAFQNALPTINQTILPDCWLIVNTSITFANDILRTKKVNNVTLYWWSVEVFQATKRIAERAGNRTTAELHSIITNWRKTYNITDAEMKTMRAVIAATPNNRVDNSYVAFFSRLFGERLYENRRVIVMELRADAPLDLQKMTNAASLTQVNNIVGSYLNQNPQLLYREWMADGVYKYLDANFAPIPDDPNVLQPLQIVFFTIVGTCTAMGITIYVLGLTYFKNQYELLVKEEVAREREFVEQLKKQREADTGLHDVSLDSSKDVAV